MNTDRRFQCVIFERKKGRGLHIQSPVLQEGKEDIFPSDVMYGIIGPNEYRNLKCVLQPIGSFYTKD
jgi:hypothetical protein